MFARVYSGGNTGVDAYRIDIEVDTAGGIGQIMIVGLPDAAVKESQERVKSAIRACELLIPPGRKWIINLAPADTRKEGPAFDLPIAVGMLAATGLASSEHLHRFWMVGELSLDGSLRPVSGVLPIAIACRQAKGEAIIVPDGNGAEAALVEGLSVFAVGHLKEVLALVADPGSLPPVRAASRRMFDLRKCEPPRGLDYADVKGQGHARRALEIAAAGRHNILMVGPPGSGKSMLAERLPGIMPPLEFEEALELTKLYSVAGLLGEKGALVCQRPFRAPHHSASAVGLIGGGAAPRPGEISLSHTGILFLDELTEFPRSHIEHLRQPLETGRVTISRAQQTLTYPASFLLVGACNPCPCGHRGDPVRCCVCTAHQSERYWSKLSGPFLDRIDLHVSVCRLKEAELSGSQQAESSEDIRRRVMKAVEWQRQRSPGDRIVYNAHLDHRQLKKIAAIDGQSRALIARAVSQLGLSARSYDRILRVARTIADLAASEDVQAEHVAEALRYRAPLRTAVAVA